MYAYIMGKGRSTSAVTRTIIENDLIEDYHWLPQDIAKIPYRKLQEFFLIRREKHNARNAKVAVEEFKDKMNAPAQKAARQVRRR